PAASSAAARTVPQSAGTAATVNVRLHSYPGDSGRYRELRQGRSDRFRKPKTRHCRRDSGLFDCVALLTHRRLHVVASCAGKAVQRSASKLGGLHCDAGQVDKDAPDVAASCELGVNGCDFSIRVKYILGHRLEVIVKRQVNLWMSEVRCG